MPFFVKFLKALKAWTSVPPTFSFFCCPISYIFTLSVSPRVASTSSDWPSFQTVGIYRVFFRKNIFFLFVSSSSSQNLWMVEIRWDKLVYRGEESRCPFRSSFSYYHRLFHVLTFPGALYSAVSRLHCASWSNLSVTVLRLRLIFCLSFLYHTCLSVSRRMGIVILFQTHDGHIYFKGIMTFFSRRIKSKKRRKFWKSHKKKKVYQCPHICSHRI